MQDLRQDGNGVDLVTSAGPVRARYVVGTDGVRSSVRRALGSPFPGRTVARSVMLADVRLAQRPPDVLTADADGEAFGFVAPFGDGWYRVIAWNRARQLPDDAPSTSTRSAQAFGQALGTDYGMHDARWLSRFHSDERQVPQYRVGRVFLAGDAAHVHTPGGRPGHEHRAAGRREPRLEAGRRAAGLGPAGPARQLSRRTAPRRPPRAPRQWRHAPGRAVAPTPADRPPHVGRRGPPRSGDRAAGRAHRVRDRDRLPAASGRPSPRRAARRRRRADQRHSPGRGAPGRPLRPGGRRRRRIRGTGRRTALTCASWNGSTVRRSPCWSGPTDTWPGRRRPQAGRRRPSRRPRGRQRTATAARAFLPSIGRAEAACMACCAHAHAPDDGTSAAAADGLRHRRRARLRPAPAGLGRRLPGGGGRRGRRRPRPRRRAASGQTPSSARGSSSSGPPPR